MMTQHLPAPTTADSSARIVALATQYPEGLIGVPLDDLRLTWQATAASPQIGYQVRWEGATSGTSEPRESDASIGVAVPAPSLQPGEVRRYEVRIATGAGWSPWSEQLSVEAAVDPATLIARPIGGSGPVEGPAALLRTTFDLPSAPLRARLRATFWGVGELRLNGLRATDEHLTPGWTAYKDRVVFGTWDVTELLHVGENALGALLGDGWYRGRLGWEDGTEQYGAETAALVQLDVDCADGTTVRAATSGEWTTSTGGIRSNSLYDGVEVDLRAEPDGWDTAGFDDSAWPRARTVDIDTASVEPRIAGGVRTIAEWDVDVEEREGHSFLDLTQNIAGWLRLIVRGSAGDRVEVRHAEVLEPDGSIHTKSLRTARATDGYVLAHDGETTLEPTFTFHGFQYAEITGAEIVSATAVAISSADRQRSEFACSEPRLERLHSNVTWSQRDNFVSLPTDCPQRDERLGWTGDAQAFAPTASTLFDVEQFWVSWLRDLGLDQDADGAVAAVVPNILRDPENPKKDEWTTMGRAGWGDAATLVPWAVYESYGSEEVLVRQLSSMRRWVDSLERRAAGGLLPTEFQFGDWLDPDAPGDQPWKAKVSSDYVANAFFAHSARLLAKTERLVGDADRADAADRLADRVARDTWENWGASAVGTQTGAAIALEFRIAPDEERDRIGEGLARNVREERGRIATGFLGTPLVLFALVNGGYTDEAFLMLLRRDAPSWLYQVEMGATTVWERWDALAPDGTIHAGEMATGDSSGMLSFNHYAYGAVVDWIYRYVAGIAPSAERPGYRRIVVAPRPSTAISWARASIETRLGKAAVDWRLSDDLLHLDLVIPYGAEAVLDLPVTERSTIEVDGQAFVDGTVGPGKHRVVVTAARIADPEALLAPIS
ncbi:alpha-L-rhamnosidase [Okibacterium sp. HSC-33S16]|uniref:family 78 glycoside hydrolase catalytic domain n=1 Tax=Okibacterium sp. HSC-33S16 TaxID=2910965 RepID=UPI00209CFF48|nr:family 78 glycoside hydrolase catalytic domain [Okibacterium sp. HSC-33S16]MCP2032624.1 alpha-L-rhamnosidase [Okibacterium sp. HSC-33S16]